MSLSVHVIFLQTDLIKHVFRISKWAMFLELRAAGIGTMLDSATTFFWNFQPTSIWQCNENRYLFCHDETWSGNDEGKSVRCYLSLSQSHHLAHVHIVLQFVGGGSVDTVVWALEPPAPEYVCCLITRQTFWTQQHPLATDWKLRSTSVRWHTSLRHRAAMALDVLWAFQCAKT